MRLSSWVVDKVTEQDTQDTAVQTGVRSNKKLPIGILPALSKANN